MGGPPADPAVEAGAEGVEDAEWGHGEDEEEEEEDVDEDE